MVVILLISEPMVSSAWPVKSYRGLSYLYLRAQENSRSCGPAALGTVLSELFGIPLERGEPTSSLLDQRERKSGGRDHGNHLQEGVSLLELKQVSRDFGVSTEGYRIPKDKLGEIVVQIELPLLLHLGNPETHFVVVYGMAPPPMERKLIILDPSRGLKVADLKEIGKRWNGFALAFSPSPGKKKRAKEVLEKIRKALAARYRTGLFRGVERWDLAS